MSDIIDINVGQTNEEVTINVVDNVIQVNINKVTGGGGSQNLQEVTDLGANTTNQMQINGVNVATVNDIPTNTSDLTNDSNFISDASYVHTDNNFTTTLKNKLDGIEAGAEVNVNADWNATSGDAQILNKPTIPSTSTFVPYTGATSNVDLGEYQIKAGQIELDQSPTGTAGVAVTRWNDSIGSIETTLKGGNVILKNGVDLVARVVNKVTPNTTLTKANYQVVKVSGAQGQRLAVSLAQANNDNNSADTLGIVIETIATNQEGFIMTVGQLEGINTTGSLQGETWADGDILYLSPTTAGRITNIKPTGATGHIVIIGYVEYSHSQNGKIYVKIMNGWELDELHNVYISSVADKQLLSYDSATSLWKNKSVTTADIAASTNKNYITDAQQTILGNTSGTNTGDETTSSIQTKLGTASASTSGYLTSTDWNTFNNKQNALGYTPYKFIQVLNSAHTGTTAETIIATATINGGTFNSSDVMKLLYGLNKGTTTSGATMRIRMNTSNTLSGATLLAAFGLTGTNTNSILSRSFSLNGGNIYYINPADTTRITDQVNAQVALNSSAYNTANIMYIFFTIQLVNSSDSVTPYLFNITN